jgi:ketosteroid isomerase-like protein
MPTRRAFARLAAGLALAATAQAALADAGAEIRALYLRFLAAQNDRDLPRVRATLWDSPDFLWVSDGRPFWGPAALVARMGSFQKAEVWRVEPDLDRGRVVHVAEGAAYLSLPLTLVIGNAAEPARLKWLVGALCRREADTWRIAALFTTEDKG